jgi:hypothetical protein
LKISFAQWSKTVTFGVDTAADDAADEAAVVVVGVEIAAVAVGEDIGWKRTVTAVVAVAFAFVAAGDVVGVEIGSV